MKLWQRITASTLILYLLVGAFHTALAAPSWEDTLTASREAGLEVTWYPDYESLTRLYGTDRMLLQQNGLFALCDLGGTNFTGFVFDAVEQQGAEAEQTSGGPLKGLKNIFRKQSTEE